MGAAAAPALQVICVPTSSFKFVSSGLELGPFPSVPVRIGLGLPGCWIPVCPKGMFCLHSKQKKKKRKRIQPLFRTMCFSEQLGRVGSCCLAVGWCQGATPFGVPAKAGFGFTAQEAGRRKWSLSMCRILSMSMFQDPGPPCTGEEVFLGESEGLLSLLQVHVLRPGFAMCWKPFPKLFPTFPCALGTAQSPGLPAYDLEMEGVSSRCGMQGQELFAGMLCTQVQCILGCLRSGLGVSRVE